MSDFPCLRRAWGLVGTLTDLGIVLRVRFGETTAQDKVLFRDPQHNMTGGLRLMLREQQEDVIALLTRYDTAFQGRPGPLLGVETWKDAMNCLIDWMGYRMGEELGVEFFDEGNWMRVVWDNRQLQVTE